MPPKAKFTRDQVISAGLEIVRSEGMEALTARRLGAELGSSSCPIFTLFESMDEVSAAVITRAFEIYNSRIAAGMESGEYPPYMSSGMAYIEFAEEEPLLFRLLFMRDRRGEEFGEDRESIAPLLSIIQKNLGLGEDEAYRFHLEMWIFVHGIATMVATQYILWDRGFIEGAMSDMYNGLRLKFTNGGK